MQIVFLVLLEVIVLPFKYSFYVKVDQETASRLGQRKCVFVADYDRYGLTIELYGCNSIKYTVTAQISSNARIITKNIIAFALSQKPLNGNELIIFCLDRM
jgi:hypothetical protein